MANTKLFDLYEEMFNLHVGTKTNDTVFHKASEAFYETLFDVVHASEEAMQDSKQAPVVNPSEARKQSYVILEKAKKIVEGMVNSNKDMGADNVLRGLVDKLGFDCGNARAFAAGECPMAKGKDKTEETPEEETTEENMEDPEEEATESEMEEMAEDAEEEYEGMDNTDEEVVGAKAKTTDEEGNTEDEKKKKKADISVVEIIPA